MKNFNHKGGRFSGGGGGKKFGGRSFGGDRRGGDRGGRDDARPSMHKATCSDCGKGCEVPFRPSGDKPIFCRDCFQEKRGSDSYDSRDARGSRDGGGSRDFHGRDRDSRSNFSEKRPHRTERPSGGATPNYRAEFEQLNKKLDALIRALTPAAAEGPSTRDVPLSKKEQRAVKKDVDPVALHDAITRAVAPKKKVRKVAAKKPAAKKTAKKKK